MTDIETEQMIAVLAETIPHDLDLGNEREVAEYLCAICAFAHYRLSAMEKNLPEIIGHAKALREAMAI
jgi:hypothetical protein